MTTYHTKRNKNQNDANYVGNVDYGDNIPDDIHTPTVIHEICKIRAIGAFSFPILWILQSYSPVHRMTTKPAKIQSTTTAISAPHFSSRQQHFFMVGMPIV